MDGKVTYLPIYMCYLVKEQSIGQLIVDLDTIENNLDLNSLKLQQVGAEISENQKLQQPVAELEFPTIFGFVPWGYHVEIVTKCKTILL